MKTFYNDFPLPITQGRKKCKTFLRLLTLLLMCLVTGGAMAQSTATFTHGADSKTRWQTKTDETSGIKVSFASDAPGNDVHKILKDETFDIESTKAGINITSVKITVSSTDYTFDASNQTNANLTTTAFSSSKVTIKASAGVSVGTIVVTYTGGSTGGDTKTDVTLSATPPLFSLKARQARAL